MSYGIEGFRSSHPAQLPPGAAPSELVGQRGGEKVVAEKSAASLVEQSLEELPSNQSERSSKRLAERTARSKSANRTLELARKYLRAVGSSTSPESFERLADQLRRQGRPTSQQLQQLLRDEHGHEQGAVLLFLEEAFSGESNLELLAVVRQVKQDLGAELQQFCRSELQQYDDVAQAYQGLLAEHGPSEFLAATESLIQKLGSDVHAEGAAIDVHKLKATLDSLYHLEVARNVFTNFSQLIDRIERNFQQKLADGPHRLMREVLPLKDQRFLDGGKVSQAVGRLQIQGDEPRIYLLRELREMALKLPDKVYREPDDRLRLTGAIQEALDSAIQEEEG